MKRQELATMKGLNNFHKYGWITMIVWNLLLVILILIVSTIRKVPFTYIFDDGMGGVGISVFLLLWSLIWYGIGYKSRKDFVLMRNMYREHVPLLEQAQFDKAYRNYYIAKQAKLLSIVFATAIPWYIIGYVDFPMATKDIIIVAILAGISVSCFCLSRKTLNFNS